MLFHGPLNKDVHTKKFELLVKCILHRPNAIHYRLERSLSDCQMLFAQVGQATINVSSMIQKVNYNHIYLSEQDSDNYQKICFLPDDPYPCLKINQEKYSNLTSAELLAIQRYSNKYYENINSFLNGYTGQFNKIVKKSLPAQLNMSVNDLVVNIGLLSSGLNKIMPDTDFVDSVFRGETVPSDILERRIELQENNKIDRVHSFISTSRRKKVATGYLGTSIIEFENPHAKDISGLSKYPGEAEYLLVPNQRIIWDNILCKNNVYFFRARVVAPLLKETQEVLEEDSESKKMHDFLRKR